MATKRQKKAVQKRQQQAKNNRIQRPETDILEHLKKQIRFISSSSRGYDSGEVDEARRIAGHIRTIVHDTSGSSSILKQLAKKDIPFYDSAFPYDPRSACSYQGLVVTELSERPRWGWVPLVFSGESPSENWRPFEEWWNAVILDDKNGIYYTRCDIVLAVCNQDGGAHVDPELDEPYVKMEKLKEFAFTFTTGGHETKPRVGAGLSSVRQVGYELLMTLQREFPAFLKGKYIHPEKEPELGPNTLLVGGMQFIEMDESDKHTEHE